jgi:tellurite resistance protein
MKTLTRKKKNWSLQEVVEAIKTLSPTDQRILKEELNKLPEVYVMHPSLSEEAIKRGQELAQEIRDELKSQSMGTLDETMRALRGRSWSP